MITTTKIDNIRSEIWGNGPPQLWRAIPKNDPSESYEFTFESIDMSDVGAQIWTGTAAHLKAILLADCHIDHSTGHDKDGAEVFGGDVFLDFETHIWRIYWREQVGQWWCVDSRLATELYRVAIKKLIGNIHNLSALPAEVRKMLRNIVQPKGASE